MSSKKIRHEYLQSRPFQFWRAERDGNFKVRKIEEPKNLTTYAQKIIDRYGKIELTGNRINVADIQEELNEIKKSLPKGQYSLLLLAAKEFNQEGDVIRADDSEDRDYFYTIEFDHPYVTDLINITEEIEKVKENGWYPVDHYIVDINDYQGVPKDFIEILEKTMTLEIGHISNGYVDVKQIIKYVKNITVDLWYVDWQEVESVQHKFSNVLLICAIPKCPNNNPNCEDPDKRIRFLGGIKSESFLSVKRIKEDLFQSDIKVRQWNLTFDKPVQIRKLLEKLSISQKTEILVS